MADTKTRTLEEAYFHISNSGVTLAVVEDETRYDGGSRYFNHRLDATLAAFGTPLAVQIPLMSVAQVQWLADALARTAEHMRSLPASGHSYTMGGCEGSDPISLIHLAGYRVEEVWTPETVTSPYSTESRHVANRLIDPDTGAVVAVIEIPNGRERGSGGSHPSYTEAAVGKPVEALTPQDRVAWPADDAEDHDECSREEISVEALQAHLAALQAEFDAVMADTTAAMDDQDSSDDAGTRTLDDVEAEGAEALASLIQDMTTTLRLSPEEKRERFEQQQAAQQEAEAERKRREDQDDMAALREQLGQDFSVVMGYDPDAVPPPPPLTQHQKEVREMRRLADLTRDGLAGKPVTAEQREVREMRKTLDVTKAVSLYPFGERGDRG